MTALHWGLLSTANINRQLIPAIRGSARGELTAVASRDQARAAAYAEKWDIPKAFGSYEAMLASPDVDVIYLSLPNSLHAEWAVKCLNAGKHVLVEKPLALTAAQVDAIQAAAQRASRVAVEAFMYQHHPQILKLQELASGALGELRAVRSSFTFVLPPTDDPRLDPALGGGSLWDVGCYPVSLAQLLLGGKPVEVFGWQELAGKRVDMTFVAQMRYAGGRLAQFDCGFETPYRTYVEALGTTGAVSTRPFRPDLNYPGEVALTINRGEREDVVIVPNPPLYTGEVEDLHEAILTGKPTRLSLAASRDHIATICALLESARVGRPVAVA